MPLDLVVFWGIVICFAALLSVVPAAWVLMHIFTPQKLLQRYFKEPHFNQGELFTFQIFPAMFLRTGIFMWACIMPSRTQGRLMTDIIDHAPKWYILCSKLVMTIILGLSGMALALTIGLTVYTKYFEPSTTVSIHHSLVWLC